MDKQKKKHPVTKKNPKGGGRPRKITPIEEVNCYNQYKNGVPIVEIAYKAGISVATLHRIIKREKEKE